MATTRLDPAFVGAGTSVAGQNTSFRLGANDQSTFVSDITFATGKIFFEAVMTNAGFGDEHAVGVVDSTVTSGGHLFDGTAGNWCYHSATGNKREEAAAAVAYGSTWAEGDIISVAFDVDNGNVWYAKNGVWQNGATDGEIAAGTTTNAAHVGIGGTGPYRLAAAMDTAGMNLFNGGTVNFGQTEPSMSIPSGYAFPDAVVTLPGGPPASGNGWERFDWSTGGAFGDGTVNTHPHPGVHVNTNGKTIEAVYGRSDGFITPIARTGQDFAATGKYYWEILIDDQGGVGTLCGFGEDALTMGVASSIPATLDGGSINVGNGQMFQSALSFLGTHSEGAPVDTDVIGYAVDMNTGDFWIAINNVWDSAGNPAAGTGATGVFTASTDMRAMVTMQSNLSEAALPTLTLQSNSGEYTYSAPSGFTDLPLQTFPKNSDAALDLNIQIDALADLPVQHGAGALDLGIQIDALADLPVQHGAGALDLAITIAATGFNVARHGDGALDLGIQIDSVGLNNTVHGDAALDLDIQINATGTAGATTGSAVLPAPLTVTGEIVRGNAIETNPDGRFRIPPLTTNGFIFVDSGLQGLKTPLPALQVVGFVQGPTEIELPALSTNGFMCNGIVLNGNAILPTFTVNGVIVNPPVLVGEQTLPGLETVGTVISGAVFDDGPDGGIVVGPVDPNNLPLLKVTGAIDGETLITGSATLPSILMDWDQLPLAAGSQIDGSVTLPLLMVNGIIVNAAVLAETVWAMNTETFETSNYENFSFVSLVSYDEQPYGVTAGGIFLLAGDDDDGTDIDATFLTGINDFNNENLKEMVHTYVDYSGASGLVLRVFVDGQTRVREYPLERDSNSTGVRNARFKGARGIRSRTWQIGLRNTSGGDFLIDKLGTLYRRLRRKTRKN